MKRPPFLLFLISGIIVLVLSVYLFFPNTSAPETLSQIEVVDTPEARTLGLSGRTALPDGYGMLFVFPEADRYGFWMKDMLVSIDIIWLSETGEIVGIEASIAPETYPKEFHPPTPVRYVLETRAGLAQERGWQVGTVLNVFAKP